MKTKGFASLFCAAALCGAIILISCNSDDGVMSKNDGIYSINTTTLSQDVKGFNGPTPLIISVKEDKIVKVEALENTETPRFFEHLINNGLLEKWNGMTVDEALNSSVDVVSGATFSSNAVIENVRLGLIYYKEHK